MNAMEVYGSITCLLGLAGSFVCLVAGIIWSVWRKTLRDIWFFLCVQGFCFFTALVHVIILIAYDDISDPNYEAYADWTLYRFVLSDLRRLMLWLGIGILCYFAFVRKNKWIRRLCILGGCGFTVLFWAMLILCRVTPI